MPIIHKALHPFSKLPTPHRHLNRARVPRSPPQHSTYALSCKTHMHLSRSSRAQRTGRRACGVPDALTLHSGPSRIALHLLVAAPRRALGARRGHTSEAASHLPAATRREPAGWQRVRRLGRRRRRAGAISLPVVRVALVRRARLESLVRPMHRRRCRDASASRRPILLPLPGSRLARLLPQFVRVFSTVPGGDRGPRSAFSALPKPKSGRRTPSGLSSRPPELRRSRERLRCRWWCA